MVVVSGSQQVITWNAAAASGVASSSLKIDGTTVNKISGPWTAPPGLNYSWAFNSLSAGNHTFVITASDRTGGSSECTGSFVVGPTISNVVVSPTQVVITWNVAAALGVTNSNLSVDGTDETIQGPWIVAPGVDYSWDYSSLAVGAHNYVITATDGGGYRTQYTGSFVVS
jgi:hypothetical protein